MRVFRWVYGFSTLKKSTQVPEKCNKCNLSTFSPETLLTKRNGRVKVDPSFNPKRKFENESKDSGGSGSGYAGRLR